MSPQDVVALVQKHRRHVELSPGVGADAQGYGLAVCDDMLADLAVLPVHAPTPDKLVEYLQRLDLEAHIPGEDGIVRLTISDVREIVFRLKAEAPPPAAEGAQLPEMRISELDQVNEWKFWQATHARTQADLTALRASLEAELRAAFEAGHFAWPTQDAPTRKALADAYIAERLTEIEAAQRGEP